MKCSMLIDRDRHPKYEALAKAIADAITNGSDGTIVVNRYADGELNIDVSERRRFAFRIMVESDEYVIVIGSPDPEDQHLVGWYVQPFGTKEPAVWRFVDGEPK